MTRVADFVDQVLALPGFKSALANAALLTLRRELTMLEGPAVTPVNWNFALMCASALTAYEEESANEAVLRIAQSCLLAGELTSDEQKMSALLLLEREGNVRAMGLADAKGLADLANLRSAPADLRLDASARITELTIQSTVGDSFVLNTFQKEFWDLAHNSKWLSISAPTSAGKSFVVRAWIKELLTRKTSASLVYLAPTRALIEEVSSGLRAELGSDIVIQTLPWELGSKLAAHRPAIFVFTQERLHIHLTNNPEFIPSFIFIDEAQNIGSQSRGILMSQVISECANRNNSAQFIFASPLSSNPEVLVKSVTGGEPGKYITGESVTVTQNLVYVNQVPRKPRRYQLRSRYLAQEYDLGIVELNDAPSDGQKLPRLAHALGGEGGNLIYANGAADAEMYAREIYGLMASRATEPCEDLDDLSEFIKETVHENYLLATYVRRGVAFHYGDIPLSIKLRVEEQFKKGNIKFLACTSTLLEGVNLPCRNIFIRNPKKGSNSPMSIADFWNLAGRAGRWGTEFQGNIFCIDTDKADGWTTVPKDRVRMPIQVSAKKILDSPEAIVHYIDQGAPKTGPGTSFLPEMESTLSFLASEAVRGRSATVIPGIDTDTESLKALDTRVAAMLAGIELDHEVVARHFGVSPMSMERLRVAISDADLGKIQLVDPRADDAFDSFKDALKIVDEHLGGPFGNGGYRLLIANLLINWMSGRPLRIIIENKAKYRRDRGQDVNYPRLIREVLAQVERIARFEAPKFLSCYSDVVKSEALRRGLEVPDLMEDIRLMLELGVTRRTEMSLIANGLSRASAVHLGLLFTAHDLDETAVRDLLVTRDFDVEDLPSFVRKEVRTLIDRIKAEMAPVIDPEIID